MVRLDVRGDTPPHLSGDVSPLLATCGQRLEIAFVEFHRCEVAFASAMESPDRPEPSLLEWRREAVEHARVAIVDLLRCPSAGARDSLFKLAALAPLAPFIDTSFELAPLVCDMLLGEFAASLSKPERPRPQTPLRTLGTSLLPAFRFRFRVRPIQARTLNRL